MSRFLQRLAEHAMGVSRPARSISASPYAPAPLLVDEASDITPNQAAPEPALLPAAPKEAPQAQGRATGPVTATTVAAPQPTMSDERALASSHAGTPPTPAILVPRTTAAEPPFMANHIRGESRPRLPAREEGSVGMHDMPAAPHRPESERAAYAPAEPFTETSGASRPDIGVKPLLPLKLRSRTIPPAPQRRFDGDIRESASPVEETTEVHVSIGRIEIAAPTQAQPAKAPAPRRRAPVSLDEYLNKRHGGRP